MNLSGAAQEDVVTWDDIGFLMSDLRTIARNLLRREHNAQTLQNPTALILTALRRQARGQQNAGRAASDSPPEQARRKDVFLLDDDINWEEITWENRDTFFRYMYRAMREALVDKAREQDTARRRSNDPLAPNDGPQRLASLSLPLHELDPLKFAEIQEAITSLDALHEILRGHISLDRIQFRTLEHPDVMLAVYEALAQLEAVDPQLATLIDHRYFADLTLKEIAKVTETPFGTMRHRLRKAENFMQKAIIEQLRKNAGADSS